MTLDTAQEGKIRDQAHSAHSQERVVGTTVRHPDTGAEVVTGSTSMKAGSAHKMILNMISTAVMIRQGHVYENLMINLRPSNIKLEDRMVRIVRDILGIEYNEAKNLLDENDFIIKNAIQNYKK